MKANNSEFAGGGGNSSHCWTTDRPKPHKNHDSTRRIASALLVAAVMLASVAIPLTSENSEASTEGWTCVIIVDGTEITTKYDDGSGLKDTDPVEGNDGDAKTGSWGFDENTGYGPFGSFYAAFDASTGRIYKHLDPSDLSKTMDGETISSADYNVMWCLPTVWMKATTADVDDDGVEENILTMSDTEFDGAEAPAHTVGTRRTPYKYLGIGVYEAFAENDKLYSRAGVKPTVDVSMQDFIDDAKNTDVDGGLSMIWNFYQWQLYRFCSLAVMENFDCQTQIGMGDVDGAYGRGPMDTGATASSGPYYGTKTADESGARLFIENAWGGILEFIGDTWWGDGFYAGQNYPQVAGTTDGLTKTSVTVGLNYGTAPYSTELDSWGLPTASSDKQSITAPDVGPDGMSGKSPIVGGYYNSKELAGISTLSYVLVDKTDTVGSRLSMVFDADPAAIYKVTFDVAGGEGEFPSLNVLTGRQFTIPDQTPVRDGFTFEGWSDGEETYQPNGQATMGSKNMVLTAVWSKLPEQDKTPIPIFPEQEEAVEVIEDTDSGSGSSDDGRTVLAIAVVVVIVAILAVLSIPKRE